MIIPPYPFTLEDPANVPLEDAWYARPQLFFSCWFRPADGRPPSQGNYTRGPDDFEMHLVFFSTFEVLKLPARSPMDDATTKLYEPSPTPILFVAPYNNVLGRVPLFPLFLDGERCDEDERLRRSLHSSLSSQRLRVSDRPVGR